MIPEGWEGEGDVRSITPLLLLVLLLGVRCSCSGRVGKVGPLKLVDLSRLKQIRRLMMEMKIECEWEGERGKKSVRACYLFVRAIMMGAILSSKKGDDQRVYTSKNHSRRESDRYRPSQET